MDCGVGATNARVDLADEETANRAASDDSIICMMSKCNGMSTIQLLSAIVLSKSNGGEAARC